MMSSRIWPSSPQISEYWAPPERQPLTVIRGEPLHKVAARPRLARTAAPCVTGRTRPPPIGQRQVLGQDAAVLDRHVPAAEIHHPRSGGEMSAMKCGLQQGVRRRGVIGHTGAS